MKTRKKMLTILVAAALLLWAAQRPVLAGSSTWSSNPTSGDWNTAANWTPETVPDATTDVATFGPSNMTDVSSENPNNYLDSAVFDSGAPPYTITLNISAIFLYGAGIVNNSGATQSVIIPEENGRYGAMVFFNSAAAGNMTSYDSTSGFFDFNDLSSAGSATINLSSASLQAHMFFWDTSTAGDATINVSNDTEASFFDSATGGNATFNVTTAAFATFSGNNDAEHMSVNCIGGNQGLGSAVFIGGSSTAGEGTFTAVGGSSIGEHGGYMELDADATGGNATFVVGGGLGAGLNGGVMVFLGSATGGNASITANGGVGGSEGGIIIFAESGTGGAANVTLNGNGELDISATTLSGITIGSLAGNGLAYLGTKTLTIGSNNKSTNFSGVIQESGSLTKIGTGTLTLSGSNTYTGTTTVTGGVLNAGNKRGSATGTGAVNVNSGTLGGRGIVSGATTIGTGSGAGAFLAPAVGSNKQTTLTVLSSLTLNADATYTYSFKAKRNKSRTDLVKANGVNINGATLDLVGTTQGRLTQGLTLTLISNTSANPISGAFSNLPDGGIVNINGNNFQASYQGGDGNDLTLTVVP